MKIDEFRNQCKRLQDAFGATIYSKEYLNAAWLLWRLLDANTFESEVNRILASGKRECIAIIANNYVDEPIPMPRIVREMNPDHYGITLPKFQESYSSESYDRILRESSCASITDLILTGAWKKI